MVRYLFIINFISLRRGLFVFQSFPKTQNRKDKHYNMVNCEILKEIDSSSVPFSKNSFIEYIDESIIIIIS